MELETVLQTKLLQHRPDVLLEGIPFEYQIAERRADEDADDWANPPICGRRFHGLPSYRITTS